MNIFERLARDIRYGARTAERRVREGLSDFESRTREQLREIERKNRAGIQAFAPCAVGTIAAFATGGGLTQTAVALCMPALVGGGTELMPIDDPRAMEWAAENQDLLYYETNPDVLAALGIDLGALTRSPLAAALVAIGLLMVLKG
jgi:hypothetical protein